MRLTEDFCAKRKKTYDDFRFHFLAINFWSFHMIFLKTGKNLEHMRIKCFWPWEKSKSWPRGLDSFRAKIVNKRKGWEVETTLKKEFYDWFRAASKNEFNDWLWRSHDLYIHVVIAFPHDGLHKIKKTTRVLTMMQSLDLKIIIEGSTMALTVKWRE